MAEIRDLLSKKVYDKKAYWDGLTKLSDYFLKLDKLVPPYDKNVDLFKKTTEERLAAAEKSVLADKKIAAIPKTIKFINDRLDNWIRETGTGFISGNAPCDENGHFNFKISFLLFPGLSDNEIVSSKEKFKERIKNLKSQGFELFEDSRTNMFRFKTLQINIDKLKNILDPVFNGHISFECSDFIDSAKVQTSIKNIRLPSVSENPLVKKKDPDKMDKDEFAKFLKEYNDLCSSFQYAKVNPSLGISVAKGDFCDLCKICGIETETSKAYDAKFAQEKEKNKKIINEENKLPVLSPNKFIKGINILYKKVFKFLNDKFYYCPTNFSINGYGNIFVTGHYLPYTDMVIAGDVSENAGNTNFDTVGEEDIYIIDNEDNRKLFDKCMSELPNAEIKSVNYCQNDGFRAISSVIFSFDIEDFL